MDGLHFNTDITSYTLDELFSLLDIKITDTSDVVLIKQLIIERTDKYIKEFTEAKRENMADFFRNIKIELLGQQVDSKMNSSQKTVIHFNNEYTPFTEILPRGKTDDLHDSNNGAGNPIHRKITYQLLNIDSRFRANYDNTTSTDYLIDLPYTLQHVIEMKICDVELSTNYYPISESLGNNYFWISTYTQDQILENSPTMYYIYIPSGNYYYEDLVTFINNSLQRIEDPLDINGFSYDMPLTIKIDLVFTNGVGNGTGKSTIGIIKQDYIMNNDEYWNIVKIELNFIAPPILGIKESTKVINPDERGLYDTMGLVTKEKKFGWMLGYRQGKYGVNENMIMHTSESIINIVGPQYVYLIVNDFNKNRNKHFIGTSRTGLLPNDIIARISIKAPTFNIQTQNDFSVYAEARQYFGPVKINKLRIQLVDEHGRILDLNHSDFSFTIRITSVYSAT